MAFVFEPGSAGQFKEIIVKIDDILVGVDTVMTEGLTRLFKSAGCSPTICHACATTIDVGRTFKLVSFKGTDEMCCAKHGEADLAKRDEKKKRAVAKAKKNPGTCLARQGGGGTITNPDALRDINRQAAAQRGEWGGYSRPSKVA